MKSNLKYTDARELFKEYSYARGMRPAKECFRYLKNMYINHKGEGVPESIPGFRKFHSAKETIHSAVVSSVNGERFFIIHEGGGLYRLPYPEGLPQKIAEIENCESKILTVGRRVIISDGNGVYMLEGDTLTPLCHNNLIAKDCLIALFDGRIFLSGEGARRGKIFYSTRLDEGAVFSEESCLNCGGDILAMLPRNGRLWIFRSSDEGGGEVSCYNAEGGYSLCHSISGVNPTGQVCSCENSILFLAEDGLWSIDDEGEGLTRLSDDIEPQLSEEDIHSASLTVWGGYVAIGCGRRIYLLDRRNGGWYFLSDVGSYKGDRRVFRYSKEAEEGYSAHKHTHGKAEGQVISLTLEDGKVIYYTEELGRKYSVYPTDEREGGDFSPAEKLFSDRKLLCFTTPDGLFIFNSDLPPWAEGKYSFDGHAAEYAVVTNPDDCGLPMTEKASVGESLMLKIKTARRTPLTVSILTDGESESRQRIAIPPSEKGSAYTGGFQRITVAERIHGWTEKQIVIEGKEFDSPIALSSLVFKYLITEKLKKG